MSKLRAVNRLPANIYGGLLKEPRAITLDSHETELLLKEHGKKADYAIVLEGQTYPVQYPGDQRGANPQAAAAHRFPGTGQWLIRVRRPAPHTTAVTEASRGHLKKTPPSLLRALGGKTSPTDDLEEEGLRIREGYQNFRLEPVEATAPRRQLLLLAAPEGPRPGVLRPYAATTQLIGHFIHQGFEVPGDYSITGAIILKRVERKFRVWGAPS